MHRNAFQRTISILLLVGTAFLGLTSCGGGGNGGNGGSPVIITPPGNRAPQIAEVIVPAPGHIALTLDPSNLLASQWKPEKGLDSYFTDPDGDSLSYSIRSSNTDVLITAILDTGDHENWPTAFAKRAGTATITITATDPQGITATQRFSVRVADITPPPGNRAPTIRSQIPDIELREQEHWTFDNISSRFSDPDGDPLTITAEPVGLNSSSVTATLSGHQLVVRAIPSLSLSPTSRVAQIRVTARDPSGLTVSQTFDVTVHPTNRPPTIRSQIPDIELREGEHWTFDNISSRFSDPDGDSLTITVMPIGSNLLVTATLSDDQLVVRALPGAGYPNIQAHYARFQVWARDAGPISVVQTFDVTVYPSLPLTNHPPTIRSRIPRIEMLRVGGSETINNVSSRFSDPDGDRLIITAEPVGLHSSYVTATLSGDQLVVRAVKELSSDVIFVPADVRVTARDPGGLTVSQTFEVLVYPRLPSSRPQVVFNISDSCNDGSAVQYRFFQYDRWRDGNTVEGGRASGVWPSNSGVYITQGLDQPRVHRLACTAGKGVCFGGNPRNNPSRSYWGTGIDGEKGCARCCVRCPTSGTATYSGGRLTCPR